MLSTIIFDLCIPRVCIMPVQPDFVGQGTHIKHMTTDQKEKMKAAIRKVLLTYDQSSQLVR